MRDAWLLIVLVVGGVVVAAYDVDKGGWHDLLPEEPGGFVIASFNTETLRADALSNESSKLWYASLIRRSDVLGLQEIRDDSGETRRALEALLPRDHAMVMSPRLGRTPYYKEQYAYIYNESSVNVSEEWTVSSLNDSMSRPPHAVRVEAMNTSVTLVNVHTDPERATAEIRSVASWARSGAMNVVVFGDLNADCAYFDPKPLSNFTWGVRRDADTTTGGTDCAYDRFLLGDGVEDMHRTSHIVESPAWLSDHRPVLATFS